MKLIDSSNPEQMKEEKRGINWKDFTQNKSAILAAVIYCYSISHLKEIRSFLQSAFFAAQDNWFVWLGVLCVLCLIIYSLLKIIQLLRFIARFFVLMFKALEKYIST